MEDVRRLFSFLHKNQRCIATLGEMIHTASLIHDDVVDSSDRRRGKPAAAAKWGPKKVRFFPKKSLSDGLFRLSDRQY